jgi:HK97 family phage major capsid protein
MAKAPIDPALTAIQELADTVGTSFELLEKDITEVREAHSKTRAEMEAGFKAHGERIRAADRSAVGRPGSERDEPELYVRGVDGSRIRLLRPTESLGSLHGTPVAGAGDVIHAIGTGKWTVEAQKAALDGGQVTGGGYLLSPAVSATIVDLARGRSAVVNSGAMTIEMPAGELKVAQLVGDPAVQWRAPNQAITPSDPTFGGVMLRARTLAVLSKVPIELVEDAANLARFIEHVFAQAIAAEIDRVALVGVGAAEEPQGIENTIGVGTSTSVGTLAYDDLVDAQATVRAANVEPSAAILNPRDIAVLGKLKGTSNDHYLEPPSALSSLTLRHTTNVPKNRGGGGAESLAFVGDFSNLWLGIRTALVVEASREAADSSGSAFANLQLWVRAYLRMDVAVVRPSAFVVLSGITA